jgi:hypothetical protein
MNKRTHMKKRQAVADFTAAHHGSLFLLHPLTPAATAWVDAHLPEDRMTWAGGVVVEPRYLDDIVNGILGDGLRCG